MVDDGVQLPCVGGSQGGTRALALEGGIVVVPEVVVGETQPGSLESIVVGVRKGSQDALCWPPVSGSSGGGCGRGQGVIDGHEAVIEELGAYRRDASQEGVFGTGLGHGSKATVGAVGMVLL